MPKQDWRDNQGLNTLSISLTWKQLWMIGHVNLVVLTGEDIEHDKNQWKIPEIKQKATMLTIKMFLLKHFCQLFYYYYYYYY